MPEALAYDHVALRHDAASADAVGPVSLALRSGERVLLLGPSGAGKSTLLHAATGLFPGSIPGTRRGTIALEGRSVESRRPADWADTCGYLFQDAAQTLAGFTVRDEIAFAPENLGVEAVRIPDVVVQAMARVGIPLSWADRRITTLSGGERQCVALAALLAQAAPITLTDEPAASLAPAAARRMADMLLAPGRTTMVVEHKPGPILGRIDRCVALGRDGLVMAEGVPDEVISHHAAALAEAGVALPLATRLHLAMPDVLGPDLTLQDALTRTAARHAHRLRATVMPAPIPTGEIIVTLEGAACAPAFGPVVLRDVSLSIHAGEVLAILGPNGAGKSTLAACLSGLLPPRAGRRTGQPGAVAFQNPEAHFSAETVRAEIAGLGQRHVTVAPILDRWGLTPVADQHPFSLSQGQKRRLSLALLSESDRWPLLILDEPTAGLDGAAEAALGLRIRALASEGRAIAVITHDLDFALSVADRAALVSAGGLRIRWPMQRVDAGHGAADGGRALAARGCAGPRLAGRDMLRAFHPLPKLALCLAWIVASLVIFRLSFQVALFAAATVLLLVDARVPLRRLLVMMVPFALFGFGFFTTSFLFRAETGFAMQMAREQGGAPEVAPGLVLFFRVMACGMTSAVFALTTDPGRFVRALMQHLRLPAPMGFALMQAMHMAPDLRDELLQLRMARAIRLGRPLRRAPTPAEAVALSIPLLAYAIRRATRAALSFEARGLTANGARSHLPQPTITRSDRIGLIVGLLPLSLVVLAHGLLPV